VHALALCCSETLSAGQAAALLNMRDLVQALAAELPPTAPGEAGRAEAPVRVVAVPAALALVRFALRFAQQELVLDAEKAVLAQSVCEAVGGCVGDWVRSDHLIQLFMISYARATRHHLAGAPPPGCHLAAWGASAADSGSAGAARTNLHRQAWRCASRTCSTRPREGCPATAPRDARSVLRCPMPTGSPLSPITSQSPRRAPAAHQSGPCSGRLAAELLCRGAGRAGEARRDWRAGAGGPGRRRRSSCCATSRRAGGGGGGGGGGAAGRPLFLDLRALLDLDAAVDLLGSCRAPVAPRQPLDASVTRWDPRNPCGRWGRDWEEGLRLALLASEDVSAVVDASGGTPACLMATTPLHLGSVSASKQGIKVEPFCGPCTCNCCQLSGSDPLFFDRVCAHRQAALARIAKRKVWAVRRREHTTVP
jgi:hypothetical protein